MPRENVESSTSLERRNIRRETLPNSTVHVSLTSAEVPPPYGAQHRQDALWRGGNEALPPLWQHFKALDGKMQFQDDVLVMVSNNRPLPGVRLDTPGQLVPGYEWHISPVGRSYFVDQNTRRTSWKKPIPQHPVGSLTPENVIEGHSECIWNLACLGINCNIFSASMDGSIRQWTGKGEPVGKPWESDGGAVLSVSVSPQETMVVSGRADGSVQLWNIKEGSMVTMAGASEGHEHTVRCTDWSPNTLEIASGSDDGTIRRWILPDIGRQIVPLPIETGHGWVYAVKYSPEGDRLVSGGADKMIRVWSKDGELLIEINGHDNTVASLCWSKDGAHIFSASLDNTIRKWRSINGEELVVFRGHTSGVRSLCLSRDECYIVSASEDYSVRIWDLKTNQPVGDPLFHDDELLTLTMTPDGKYIASAGLDAKIYIWSLEAALTGKRRVDHQVGDAHDSTAKHDPKLKGRLASSRDVLDVRFASRKQSNNINLAKYGDDFWGNDANGKPRRSAPLADLSSRWRNLFGSLRLSARPANASQPIPPQPRRWIFSLSPVRIKHSVEVAPARDEDRYGIAPPSEAEVAAAMLHASENTSDSSMQQHLAAAKAQGSQVCMQGPTRNSSAGAGESSWEIGCCGFYISHRPSTSH